jgi:hypothetical protein
MAVKNNPKGAQFDQHGSPIVINDDWSAVRVGFHILIFFCLLIAFARHETHIAFGLNSDLVQSYLLILDMQANPMAIADWSLPSSLSIFPDWLLAFPLTVIFANNLSYILVIYPALLLSLYCLTSALLLSRFVRLSVLELSWILAGIIVLATWSTFRGWSDPLSSWLFITSLSPNIHTGAIVMSLLSAWLLMLDQEGIASHRHYMLLAMISWLTAFSDALFVVWFLVPAMSLLIMQAWVSHQWRPFKIAMMMAVSGFSAVGLEGLLRADRPSSYTIPPLQATELFLKDVVNTIARGDVVFTIMLMLMLVILVRGSYRLYQLLSHQPIHLTEYFELLITFCILVAIGAPIITGLYTDIVLWRYLLIIPALVVIWSLQHLLLVWHHIHRVWLIGSISTVLIGTATASGHAITNITALSQPSALEQCLQTHRRNTGLGGYWIAKVLMFRSNRRIHIMQMTPSGEPFHVVYNNQWYQIRADDGSTVQPDFIIVNDLDPKAMQQHFGMPDEHLHCAGYEIWLYDQSVSFVL